MSLSNLEAELGLVSESQAIIPVVCAVVPCLTLLSHGFVSKSSGFKWMDRLSLSRKCFKVPSTSLQNDEDPGSAPQPSLLPSSSSLLLSWELQPLPSHLGRSTDLRTYSNGDQEEVRPQVLIPAGAA